MFGHPSQRGHMMRGVQAAAKSSKTPAHLKPHLEARMKANKGVFTGSRGSGTKPYNVTKTPSTSSQAENLLSKTPAPFANPQGAVHMPAPTGPNLGTGNGKSKNSAGIAKRNAKFFGR